MTSAVDESVFTSMTTVEPPEPFELVSVSPLVEVLVPSSAGSAPEVLLLESFGLLISVSLVFVDSLVLLDDDPLSLPPFNLSASSWASLSFLSYSS